MSARGWLRRLFRGEVPVPHVPDWEGLHAARARLDGTQARVERLRTIVELRARHRALPPEPEGPA